MQQFPVITRIRGLSEKRRLPRLGKIRLGVKALSKGGQTYPVEVDYFIVPPEVAAKYGPKPKALDIMIPIPDRDLFFPQARIWWAAGGLKCKGDGQVGYRRTDHGGIETLDCRTCPVYQQQCFDRAHLLVMLPKVNLGGYYQIDTGSINSMIDIPSCLETIEAMVGRYHLIPLVLTRVPRVTFGGGHRATHYPLMITPGTTDLGWINALRTDQSKLFSPATELVLAPPAEEPPAEDADAVVVSEEELARDGFLPPASAEPAAASGAGVTGNGAEDRPSAASPDAHAEREAKPSVKPAAMSGASSAHGASGHGLPKQPGSPRPSSGAEAKPPAARPVPSNTPSLLATPKQRELLRRLAEERGRLAEVADVDHLTRAEASRLIEAWLKEPPRRQASPAEPAAARSSTALPGDQQGWESDEAYL